MVTAQDMEAVQVQECLISVGGACGYDQGYRAGSGAGVSRKYRRSKWLRPRIWEQLRCRSAHF